MPTKRQRVLKLMQSDELQHTEGLEHHTMDDLIGRIKKAAKANMFYTAEKSLPTTVHLWALQMVAAIPVVAPAPEGEQTLAIKGSFCSNNGDVLSEAAIQGLGITLLPSFIVEEGLADGRLVRLLEDYERASLTLFALYPSRRHVPAKTRRFLEFLLEHLAEPG